MSLVDTHTHLESFAHRGVLPDVLARARQAEIQAMIAIGTSPDDWELYRQLALANPSQIHYSVGLHPCAVDATWKSAVDQVAGFWSSSGTGSSAESVRPVALGEIGLDRFHLPKDDPARAEEIFDWQRRAFAEGLRLAKELSCPVVIHSRGAFAECVDDDRPERRGLE